MNRCAGDWRVLGFSDDPIPGDADAVEAAAQRFTATAHRISEASTNLRRLDKRETSSVSVDKVLAKAHEVAGELDIVGVRYDAAAGALTSYAPVLRQAQSIADQAYADAEASSVERRQAEDAARSARSRAGVAVDETERVEAVEVFNAEMSRCDRASAAVEDARHRLQQAIRDRDTAGEDAATRISNAIADSPINDTWGDRAQVAIDTVLDAVTPIVKWVWDHIDAIALVLAIAAVFATGGGALPALLVMLANGAKVLAFVKPFLELATGVHHGLRTGEWGEALEAGTVAALSLLVGGIALRGGKIVSTGFKGQTSRFIGGKVSGGVTTVVHRFNAALPALRRPRVRPSGSVRLPGANLPGAQAARRLDEIIGRSLSPLSERSRDLAAARAGEVAEELTDSGVDAAVQLVGKAVRSRYDAVDGRSGTPTRVVEQRCEAPR